MPATRHTADMRPTMWRTSNCWDQDPESHLRTLHPKLIMMWSVFYIIYLCFHILSLLHPLSLPVLPLPDLLLEKLHYDISKHTFNQLATTDGENMNHYYVIFPKLCQYNIYQNSLNSNSVTGIKKSCKGMLLQMAHYNPIVGHLGADKPLQW